MTPFSSSFKFLVVLILFTYQLEAQEDLRITIDIPSVEEEASSIWRTINDIKFLESQGYKIHLPEHPVFEDLIKKSKEGAFSNEDFPIIYQVLESEIYDIESYSLANAMALEQLPLLNRLVNDLVLLSGDLPWDFNLPEHYRVVFTLYGTGGSYDVSNALVTLFTNREGKFMNYKNPANTIIHEIVHIGIEESLVQHYKLSHGNKERLVDSIVKSLFSDELPHYKIQKMGDPRISDLLHSKTELKNIQGILERL